MFSSTKTVIFDGDAIAASQLLLFSFSPIGVKLPVGKLELSVVPLPDTRSDQLFSFSFKSSLLWCLFSSSCISAFFHIMTLSKRSSPPSSSTNPHILWIYLQLTSPQIQPLSLNPQVFYFQYFNWASPPSFPQFHLKT